VQSIRTGGTTGNVRHRAPGINALSTHSHKYGDVFLLPDPGGAAYPAHAGGAEICQEEARM
jgi:hypothetical protein